MSNDVAVIRSMIIYAICLPLAIILGYLICDPQDKWTVITIASVLFMLVLPLLLRWYHVWLIALWNMAVVLFFLPGDMPGWAIMAFLGFGVSVGHYILNRERKFLLVPSITWSLVFIGLVVLITAKMRGGIGLQVLGDSAIGGKRYFYIWLAILGYFALTSQAIPPNRRRLYACLFLFGGMTQAIGEIAGMLGGGFHVVYLLFPMGSGSLFADEGGGRIVRYTGLANAMSSLVFGITAYYGIEGLLNFRKLWRPLLLGCAVVLATLGGSRAIMMVLLLTLGFIAYFGGVLRSRVLPVILLGMVGVGCVMVGFADKMPLSLQRSISFLPLKLNPLATASAKDTAEWRLEMWRSLLPQIPQYLVLGKGLAMDKSDWMEYQDLGENQVGGDVGGSTNLAGDYHSGPLSLLIQFGIFGCIGFVWFLVASIKVLWRNYKYGDPDAQRINVVLLSFFLTKMLIFIFVFGGFYGDLMVFTGTVGLSISLNGGVAKKVVSVPRPRIVFNRFRPLPMDRPVPAG